MSPLISSGIVNNYPDITSAIFFDDFIGSSYGNEVWSSSSATLTWQNGIGGRILIRAPIGTGSAEFYMGNNAAYSAATNIIVEWKGKLIPASTGSSECGVDGSGDQANNWICWHYAPATNTRFLCQCGSTSGTTTVSSGVTGNANEHYFRIKISTGIAEFWLDNVLRTTVTTNISTSFLQPYVWLAASGSTASDANMDYVLITGGR